MSEFRHHFVELESGVRLHVVEYGSGPLVVLLHGFPDFWYGWRKQIRAIAEAGFRVVVPDQRGYNTSDKPAERSAYGIRSLALDVASLIKALGAEKAHVVGHDWGSGAAWALAMAYPERVDRLAVLNGPHPERMLSGLRSARQLARSWYMFMFQLPALPELILRRENFAILARAIKDEPTRPNAVSDDDVALYREAWSQPGAIEGMIAWYRSMFDKSTRVRMRVVTCPVLVLWGDGDKHLGVELATPLPNLVPNARVEIVKGASHWVQVDAPEIVNQELITFFNAKS